MTEQEINAGDNSEIGPPRRIGRSMGVVLAGMCAGIILSLASDELLHLARVFPPWGDSMVGFDGPLLLATIYRTIYIIASSYLTARLAPNRPMLHALAGGVAGRIGIRSRSSYPPYHQLGPAASSA